MQKNKYKVLVVGELNVDIILNQIAGFPEVGKEIIADQLTITLGSSSAIFASNLCSLDCEVGFVGKIGKDDNGKLVRSALESTGVNTSELIETADHQTGITVVMNYGMDRANVTYPGAMNHLSATEIEDTTLKNYNHLHVSSVFLQPELKKGLVGLFQRAKDLGLSTSIDPQWDPSENWDMDLREILPLTDVFLPNVKEFQWMTKTNSLEEGFEYVKHHANIIVVKDGERGAHMWHQGNVVTKPAFLNANVADCIGAGDSFDAGFICQYIKSKELDECLTFGNITGALNTTAHGGTSAFADPENIKAYTEEKLCIEIK